MTNEVRYRYGDWIVYCMVCGRKCFGTDAKKRWDGVVVCPEDYDSKPAAYEPQPVGRPERPPPFFGQKPPEDVITDEDVTPPTSSNPRFYS